MKAKHYFAGLILALCLIVLGSSSPVFAEGMSLTLDGSTKTGNTKKSLTYTIEPKGSGIVSFKVCYDSILPVKATFKNNKAKIERTVESTVVDGKSTILFDLGVEKEKYDIVLDFQDGSKDINYTISAKFKEINLADGNGGSSFDKAVNMTNNDQRFGVVAFGEGIDCYKVSIKSQDNVDVKIVNYSTNGLVVKIYNAFKDMKYVEVIPVGSGEKVYSLEEACGIYYVTLEGNNELNQPGIKYSVTVGDYVPITKVKLSSSKLNLTVGDIKNLKTTVTPSNATEKYLYKSSNSKVVKVNNAGKIRAVKAGSAVIKVYSVNGKLVDTCKVTVKNKPKATPVPTKVPAPTKVPSPTKAPTPSKAKAN